MKDLTYGNMALVLESWNAARQGGQDFDINFGMVALQKFFQLQPRAKAAFRYGEGENIGRKHALVHARAFAGLFDSVFQMLGPDAEFIEEILKQVGARHKAMGVNPSHFPFLGQALIFALEHYLGKPLTIEQREAWEEVFDMISNEIIKHILS